MHKQNSKSPGQHWIIYYATSVDHRKRKKQPGGLDDVDAVASIQLAPDGRLLFKWSPTATEEDWEKLYNYGIVLGTTQHEHFIQLRSIQTGPAIELPLANNPQKLPFEWRTSIPSRHVFLEVLWEGFPPLKLVAGDPAGLSTKPEQALWKHPTADYVGLAISWQTEGQKTSVVVDPRYMLVSLGNKWVPLFSKPSLFQRNQDAQNRRQKMTQELDTRRHGRTTLQEQRNQARNIQYTIETGGISAELYALRNKQIDLANTNTRNNEEAIGNLKRNLIPAIDADLKRLLTLQQFADACKHHARIGFRLYCKAEDHKLVLYEALPTETVKGKPAGRQIFGTTLKAGPSPPPNLNKGLVAWYPFNGNAKDESGNQNDGKVKGAILSQNRHGNPNLAYRFDGKDDYISAPHQPYLNFPSGNLTISMWSTIQNRNAPIHFIGKDTGGGTRPKWIFIFRGGHLSFRVVPPNNAWYASTNFRLPQVGWHHYLVTKNGSRYTIYVDGMSVSQSDGVPDLPTNNSAPLTIGQAEGGGWINGSIDDVRIYNRALSATEVKSLYDHKKQPATVSSAKSSRADSTEKQVGIPRLAAVCRPPAPHSLRLYPDVSRDAAAAGYE